MSVRTILEINHDHLSLATVADVADLLSKLPLSLVAGLLNQSKGDPVNWGAGIRILAQRHHSEKITLEVK